MSRNFADGHSWVPGTVFENDGTTAVRMRLDDGCIWRRHLYHVTHSQVVEELEGQDSQQSQTIGCSRWRQFIWSNTRARRKL